MNDFIDYHCHLLPSLDDGAANLSESLAMARILSEFGFSAVHCTPHLIRGGYENEAGRVRRSVGIMERHLRAAGIPLKLIPGNEHYLDQYLPEILPNALTTGDGRYLLVEVPFQAGPELLHPMVDLFAARGLAPLIAHPERCRAFAPEGERGSVLRTAFSFLLGREGEGDDDIEGTEVAVLKRLGCRFQGNLGSFAGYYGHASRERALLFLKHGIYSCVGSDAHRSEDLREMLAAGRAAIEACVGQEAARSLLRGAGLLADAPPPAS